MEFHCRNFVISLLLLLSLSFPPSISYKFFSPVDNHLVNCGSAEDTTVDNRRYSGDWSNRKLPFCPSDLSVALRNENPSAGSSQLYDTARVFKKPSEFKFDIREKGIHMVRLHFQNLNSSQFDFGNAQFNVLVNKYVVLSNFNGGNSVGTPLVKEYLIRVDSELILIRFFPTESSKFAFVNAIEVISAPKDLVPNNSMCLNSNETMNFNGWSNQALEVVYRVNVGGPKVTPFNDTLWRTWVVDDEYLESSSGSERVYFGGRIKYQAGFASREIGPDNVYNSARLIRSNGSIPNHNITWVFPVTGEGYNYLVRLHFCDIASISLELLFFNVYVNGKLALENLDLSSATNEMLASPYYADIVVADSDISGALNVSVGPSKDSVPYAIDGILNGVEILKLSNSMGSFDGPDSADVVLRLWPGRTGLLIPMVAAVLLVLSLSIVLRRKITETKEALGWSKLPVNVSEFDAKLGV